MKKLLLMTFCFAAFVPLACTNKITVPAPGVAPTPTSGPAATPTPVPAWQAVGNLDFSPGRADYSQIYISNNGTPYVAFSDYTNNEDLTVEDFNGTSWVTVGSFDFAASADYTTLWVYNNTPYVAFDPGGGTGITAMMFNGSSWVQINPPNAATDYYPSLSGYNGTPYLAYQDTSGMAMVVQYTGGSWVTVGNPDFSPGNTAYLTLDARSGTPYLGFCDNYDSQMATVMKLNGSTWSLVGNEGFSAGIVDGNTHMLMDNGTPYFSYTDQYNGTGATVQEFNGSSWQVVATAGFPGYGTNLTAIAAGPGGIPYLTVQNSPLGYDPVYGSSGGSWVMLGTQNFMVGDGQEADLATNANGNPYIVYQDDRAGQSGNVCVYEYH